jgi:hypothetical protein
MLRQLPHSDKAFKNIQTFQFGVLKPARHLDQVTKEQSKKQCALDPRRFVTGESLESILKLVSNCLEQ